MFDHQHAIPRRNQRCLDDIIQLTQMIDRIDKRVSKSTFCPAVGQGWGGGIKRLDPKLDQMIPEIQMQFVLL